MTRRMLSGILNGGSFSMDDLFDDPTEGEEVITLATQFAESRIGFTFIAGGQKWRVIRDQGVPHHARLVVKDSDTMNVEPFFAQLHDDKTLTIQKLNKRGEYKGVGKNIVKVQA